VTPCTFNLKFGEMEFGEMKRIGAILHASASRGFVSVSWAFLFLLFGKQQEIVTKPLHRLIDVKNQ